jgi:hypothetical protein
MAFWPMKKKQGSSSPHRCQRLAGRRSLVGGGVAGKQADRVADQIGGGGEGGGLIGRLVNGGGDRRWGKDIGKPE